jgi:uncharacterized protein YjbI with pentapeptide repeats
MRGSDLWATDFGGASLANSDLSNAYLSETKLHAANLTDADLSGTHYFDVGAIIEMGAILCGTITSDRSIVDLSCLSFPIELPTGQAAVSKMKSMQD